MATSIRALKPHEQRVVEEEQQLADRHQKLSAFIGSSVAFRDLPQEDVDLLIQQQAAMGQYLTILRRRIARFTHSVTEA